MGSGTSSVVSLDTTVDVAQATAMTDRALRKEVTTRRAIAKRLDRQAREAVLAAETARNLAEVYELLLNQRAANGSRAAAPARAAVSRAKDSARPRRRSVPPAPEANGELPDELSTSDLVRFPLRPNEDPKGRKALILTAMWLAGGTWTPRRLADYLGRSSDPAWRLPAITVQTLMNRLASAEPHRLVKVATGVYQIAGDLGPVGNGIPSPSSTREAP
jgi:hypothetical protein